jgi:hypothetical protein
MSVVETPMLIPRRSLLQAGMLSLAGLSWPELLRARAASEDLASGRRPSFGRAKRCIFLCMWGGPAHQDTWDLKPDAPAEFRGEFKPIATSVPGTRICEHLPLLAQRVHQLAIIRSMTHTNVDHLTATHFVLTGQAPPNGTDRRSESPHVGAVLARLGRGTGSLPPFVSMRPKLNNDVPRFVEQSRGQWAGWLGPSFDPFSIDADPSRSDYRVGEFALQQEMTLERLRHRRGLWKELSRRSAIRDAAWDAMDAHQRRAFELLDAGGAAAAFDLSQEPLEVRQRYGLNPHGQSVLQARRLLEWGVPLVSVYWPSDGIKNVSVYWDTHSRNFVDLKERLMPVTDRAFSALLDDLADRGLLADTLVIWTGEFGRTPRVGQRSSDAGAGADGRDHWAGCFTSVLAGGGVAGGALYGSSDKVAAYPASDPVTPADLLATIYHLLGVPADQSLPDGQGRPHFVRTGRVLDRLLV